ncbi:hypothetical protein [Streptomyces sp. NPDC001889]
MTDFDRYAVRHTDGRWLYHLPNCTTLGSAPRTGIYADGQPMTRVGGERSPWWSSAHQAERITVVCRPYPKAVRYVLSEPSVRSERYPDVLSAEEWDELRSDDTYSRFYDAITEEQPDQEVVYEGPFRVLHGDEPPSPDAPGWVARLPHSLTEHPEYLHCFPGHIPGLQAHLTSLIKPMRHVDYCFSGRDGKPDGLYVTIQVPFQQPVSRWRPNLGRNGRELKSGQQVPVLVRQEIHLPVADRVAGPDYATALSQREEQIRFWTGVVRDAAVRACNHCEGTGYLLDAPDAAQ